MEYVKVTTPIFNTEYHIMYTDTLTPYFGLFKRQPFVHFVAALLYLSVFPFGVGGLMWM